MQFFSTPIGERVDVAFRFPLLLFSVTGCKSLASKLLQDWINLPVALMPKVGYALFNCLFNCITRHGTGAQHPQYGIPALIFFRHLKCLSLMIYLLDICHKDIRMSILSV